MTAARKIKQDRTDKVTPEDIQDLYYISINEICERTTYSRKSIERYIKNGLLKAEKKNNGKVVVKLSNFNSWWSALNA